MTLAVSPGGRRYGYRRDKIDVRDLGMLHFRLAPLKLPSSVDLSPWTGPVKDQGDLGACTAFAGCGMREFLARKYQNIDPVLSPLFLYYKEREFDNDLGQGDTGSEGRTSVHVMNSTGVCLESTDPYTPATFENPPTDAQIIEAGNYRAGAYHRIGSVMDMKACLASGYAFVVGFLVYDSFESTWEIPGRMPVPNQGKEQILGGHEVLFIGYDDNDQAFLVRNSWGAGWGLSGNFKFPYQCAADPNILQDAWIQHLGKPW